MNRSSEQNTPCTLAPRNIMNEKNSRGRSSTRQETITPAVMTSAPNSTIGMDMPLTPT